MKKYILLGVLLVLSLLLLYCWLNYSNSHNHNRSPFQKKLLKEVIVDLRDSACFKQSGIYKRVYRKYNYSYVDSTKGYIRFNNFYGMEYATTPKGDTVFMEFIDYTNYPRREE